jgi:dihydrofolate synthase/folylpolyglutamate synthase
VIGAAAMPGTVAAALRALGCRAQVACVDFHWQVHGDHYWDYRAGSLRLERLPPPALAGAIQYRNAACALTALQLLRAPAPIDPAAIATGLRAVRLPGRLQFVPGAVEWVFDVAHNEPAAAILAGELQARPVRGRTFVIFGMLADKDVAAVAAQLAPLVDHWLLCTLDGPRALRADELRVRIGAARGSSELCADVSAATERAASQARPGDRVLVCGSFHTVGPALQARGLY